MIQAAGKGSREDRGQFALRYAPAIRSYLGARWRASPSLSELEDAVQEVFLECFREGGVLQKADESRPGGFRAFLYGVMRNVALRFESQRAGRREVRSPSGIGLEEVEGPGETPSRIFDRAWAELVMKEAGERLYDRSKAGDKESQRKVELLRLRFEEGLPIREIARLWAIDPAEVHREFARARADFHDALHEVVRFHNPSLTSGDAERECEKLLSLLRG
jgi:RNA polymerase sigma-70 factor (ECF subfamily)